MYIKLFFGLTMMLLGLNTHTPIRCKEFIYQPKVQKISEDSLPKVDVTIKLLNPYPNKNEKIMVLITIKNNSDTIQKVLFDEPRISTGGPWKTSATLVNLKNNKSMVKYMNKSILSSKVYFENELKSYYCYLRPNEMLQHKYAITDIILLNTNNFKLPSGKYRFQIFYYRNASNVLEFRVK
ncbi:hypothetical protein ACG2LH_11365 [Zhouia sp. PK063]|uniref:hypothetical protein n=1 Tax=Zhouia sp. PK063 TaxID=3373602 RepID=UPI0037941A98